MYIWLDATFITLITIQEDREINSRFQVPLPPCSETISQAAASI